MKDFSCIYNIETHMSLYGPVAGSALAEIMSKAWEFGTNVLHRSFWSLTFQ